eukprot:13574418-Alexandrium_andersonii.AAC.1
MWHRPDSASCDTGSVPDDRCARFEPAPLVPEHGGRNCARHEVWLGLSGVAPSPVLPSDTAPQAGQTRTPGSRKADGLEAGGPQASRCCQALARKVTRGRDLIFLHHPDQYGEARCILKRQTEVATCEKL